MCRQCSLCLLLAHSICISDWIAESLTQLWSNIINGFVRTTVLKTIMMLCSYTAATALGKLVRWWVGNLNDNAMVLWYCYFGSTPKITGYILETRDHLSHIHLKPKGLFNIVNPSIDTLKPAMNSSPWKYLISSIKSVHPQTKLQSVCHTHLFWVSSVSLLSIFSVLSEIIQEMKTSSCPLNIFPIRYLKENF